MWLVVASFAQTVLTLDGSVADDGSLFERVEFEVPAGVVELELRHASLNPANFFDWGVDDPDGFRGWGGGNSEPAVIGVTAASRSYLPGPLPAGTWAVTIGKPVMGGAPFDYSLEVVLRTESTLIPRARQPYQPAPALSVEARWYAGDFHVHSLESGDASAQIDAIAELAAERGLDFVVISDHNTNSTVDFLVDAQGRHPDVLLIPGQEFTTYGGHGGAIGVTRPLSYALGLDGATVPRAISEVHGDGGLFSINHPRLDLGDLCRGCPWEHEVDMAEVDAVEIMTGAVDPVGGLFLEATLEFWEQAVLAGNHLAAIGGSDDHKAGVDLSPTQSPIGSPTTMVFAEELSVQAILDGVSAGATVVKLQDAADPMVELLTSGSLVARVTGAVGAELRWVVDGEPAGSLEIDADPFEGSPDLLGGRESVVRAEIWVDGAPRTITSHRWFTPTEPADSEAGCGCSAEGGLGLGSLVSWLGRRRDQR